MAEAMVKSALNQKTDKTSIPKSDEIKISESEKVSNQEMVNINKNATDLKNNLVSKVDTKIDNDLPVKTISKPKKELPIEKKPFQEFINIHLIPEFILYSLRKNSNKNYI